MQRFWQENNNVCFQARNFLSRHTCQCVMHISSDICIFALWVGEMWQQRKKHLHDWKGKKCRLMFVKMNKSGLCVCLSVGFICSRGVNARGCGPELSGGTIQTSKTRFLLCKQVSSKVSWQLRLSRYQANRSLWLLPKHTLDHFLACTYLHLFTIKRENSHFLHLRFPGKEQLPWGAGIRKHSPLLLLISPGRDAQPQRTRSHADTHAQAQQRCHIRAQFRDKQQKQSVHSSPGSSISWLSSDAARRCASRGHSFAACRASVC